MSIHEIEQRFDLTNERTSDHAVGSAFKEILDGLSQKGNTADILEHMRGSQQGLPAGFPSLDDVFVLTAGENVGRLIRKPLPPDPGPEFAGDAVALNPQPLPPGPDPEGSLIAAQIQQSAARLGQAFEIEAGAGRRALAMEQTIRAIAGTQQ